MSASADKTTHIRYLIVAMLFIASSFSYGDRVALSFAGPAMEKELALDPVKLGILFSGFSWAYVPGQLPSGGLLDRFGSKRVYGISIVLWSVCALLIGLTGHVAAAWVSGDLCVRLISGLAQSPVFPGNGRIVAAWFPTAERGGRVVRFQRVAVLCAVDLRPAVWMAHPAYGWRSCFWFMGFVGFVLAFAWWKLVYNVTDHPMISRAEIETHRTRRRAGECGSRGGGEGRAATR